MNSGSKTSCRTREGTRSKLLVVLLVAAAHILWVIYVAGVVKEVCRRGDNGLQLWILVAIPDLPVSYLLYFVCEVFSPGVTGDLWFWGYTWHLWGYAIVGSIQWAVLAWCAVDVVRWLRRMSAARRGFPVLDMNRNGRSGLMPEPRQTWPAKDSLDEKTPETQKS